MSFSKILCPVDFSPTSREAVRVACALAREGGGGLTLLHICALPVPYAGELPMPLPDPATLIAAAEQELAGWRRQAEEARGGPVATLVEVGVAWERIVARLEAEPTYDLVVLGTHGRTGLKRALIGSVAERIVRHAPCPVLVVRPKVGA